MKRFVPDTNVYIQAIRNAEVRTELAAWQRIMAPYIWQHAVVVAELLVGAKDEETWQRWHDRWVAPAERVRRILVPTYANWVRASRIIARLADAGNISAGGVKTSFFNDCLLAASAREHGFLIVTWNRAAFELIAEVEPGLRTAAPFP